MSDKLKQKFMEDVKVFAELKYPSEDGDQNLERDFITNLAGDYYDGKINETKLLEQFGTIAEEQEQKNNLVKAIQTFKAKHMPKPKVEEKKPDQKKGGEIVNEKKSEKAKIFDRMEGGVDQPSKKVKKDQNNEEKEEEKEEDGTTLKENLKKKLQTEGKQKCKFFPYCKNEETCEYFHPTQKV